MNYTSLEEKAKEKDEEILQLKLKLDKLQKEIDFANNVIQLKDKPMFKKHTCSLKRQKWQHTKRGRVEADGK